MDINIDTIKELGNLNIIAKQVVEGFITGLHKSPYHGFSVEFAEHKLYNTGESTRFIDWKLFAKTEKLYTKRFEEETNLRCYIIIDVSSSMYYPVHNYGKVLFSSVAAAALSYLLCTQRDAFGLFTFSDSIVIQTPVKSTFTHWQKILLILNNIVQNPSTQKTTHIAKILHQIAPKIHKKSLLILFSDILTPIEQKEELFAALQHLKHNKHEILIFHVTEPNTEKEFLFEQRPYIFHDLETNTHIKINPTDIKENYQKNVEAFYEYFRNKCGQLKIDTVEVNINTDFNKVLNEYLIKRSQLH
ncbi:MAG: DUF58 domain-containing protein [Chitinophagaceae bacterium]|nr:DUF58 domain-containing protein [Chitinophagaceae bacterium]